MSKKNKIDWVKVILNLRDQYKPIADLAEELGINRLVLQKIMSYDTDEPKYSIGVKLLELQAQHCMNK